MEDPLRSSSEMKELFGVMGVEMVPLNLDVLAEERGDNVSVSQVRVRMAANFASAIDVALKVCQ